jgi:hypothetical protein
MPLPQEDFGKTLVLAEQIKAIAVIAQGMDLEHVKKASKAMTDQGDWQDSAAVLNPMNPLEKNDLLRLQGKALMKLAEYVELLKKIYEGKVNVHRAEQAMRNMMDQFL